MGSGVAGSSNRPIGGPSRLLATSMHEIPGFVRVDLMIVTGKEDRIYDS